jgi:hypothetical protein
MVKLLPYQINRNLSGQTHQAKPAPYHGNWTSDQTFLLQKGNAPAYSNAHLLSQRRQDPTATRMTSKQFHQWASKKIKKKKLRPKLGLAALSTS